MTTHELARRLLNKPDMELADHIDELGIPVSADVLTIVNIMVNETYRAKYGCNVKGSKVAIIHSCKREIRQ